MDSNNHNGSSSHNYFNNSPNISEPLNYQEQFRRQLIMNSLENKDYLMVIASQQNKSIEQVKYELKLQLIYGG